MAAPLPKMVSARPKKASGEVLNSQSRKIIYNVLQFCKQEKQKGILIPLDKAVLRAAEAVGKSERTIRNIAREVERAQEEGTRIKTPGIKRNRPKKFPLGEFDKCLVRRTYLEFVEQKGEIPTVQKLLSAVNEKISYLVAKSTFWSLLKDIGYMSKKWKNMRPLLIERSDIVAQRTAYLRTIRINANGPRKPVVYTGETSIHFQNMTEPSQKNKAPKTPRTKGLGQRAVVIHAGGEMGFIKGAEFLRCPKPKTLDYCNEISAAEYMKWLQKQLIPSLPAGCIVVLHHASYNMAQECGAPTLVTNKSEILSWLRRNNVSVDETLTKRELLEVVRAHRPEPVYTVDRILQLHGFSVLRLPPYHWDLSPLELIWNSVKQKLAAQNGISNSPVELKKLVLNTINEITEEDWKKEFAHVRQIQENYWCWDTHVEHQIDKFTADAQLCIDECDSKDGDNEPMEEDCSSADISEGSSTESADETKDEVIVGYPPFEEVYIKTSLQ